MDASKEVSWCCGIDELPLTAKAPDDEGAAGIVGDEDGGS